MATKVVVLGASGQTGRRICRLLLQSDGFDVTACGRKLDRLKELQTSLQNEPGSGSFTTRVVDVESNDGELDHIVAGADIVVGATSRSQHATRIAEAAALAGTSYAGLYLSSREKWKKLRSLEEIAVQNGVALIDDCGTHPGVPGALIRLAAGRMKIAEAWVGAKFSLQWSDLGLSVETVEDFVDEIKETDYSVFKNGEWVKGTRHSRRFDFGGAAGRAYCIPMCMEEIRSLPEDIPGLESTGFFIAGFGPAVDYLVFPISMTLDWISRRLATRFLWWGLKSFESTQQYGVIVLEGVTRGGQTFRYRISHADTYAMTAIPVVATLLQMRDLVKAGAWTQADYVYPELFFESIQRMGLDVDISGSTYRV